MIGALPNTGWLPDAVARSDRGFVLTGADAAADPAWPCDRSPLALETSMPGVFAAGDVRHGSMSRVASAVGEGSIAIKLVHELFAGEQALATGRTPG
jgi:thioredoxin reductase (NADPH)